MSADTQPGKGSPEQQEWQGQRWEYLVVNLDAWSLRIRNVFGHAHYAPHYESYFKKTNKEFDFVLGFLGDNGWELAGMNTARASSSDDLRLFFKRPRREE